MFSRLGVVCALTFFILVSEMWPECCADVFSAMFKMEHLLETRQRVIDDLDTYIHKEEIRLRDLKLYLEMYKTEHKRAIEDKINYTGNPINAFILIKRLTSDLDDIEELINKPTEFVSVRNVTTDDNNATILYPSAVDLQGAAVALKRLQRTYKLRVEDLAKGVLDGVVYRLPMTAGDCYKLGVVMIRKKDYLNALAWLMEALRKFKLEDNIPHTFSEIDILDNIAFVHEYVGDEDNATDWILKILDLDPDHKRAQKALLKYCDVHLVYEDDDDGLEVGDAENETGDTTSGAKDDNNAKAIDVKNKSDSKSEAANKTEGDFHSEMHGELAICPKDDVHYNNVTYYTEDKTDILFSSKIVIDDNEDYSDTKSTKNSSFTEINNDSQSNTSNDTVNKTREIVMELVEIKKSHKMSENLCRGEYDIAPEISSRLTCHYVNKKPFLKLAPIKAEQRYIDPDVFIFHDVISDEEIAHVKEMANTNPIEASWLDDYESEVVARLSRRIGDFTGFSELYTELLQVSNYGVGGHYAPHFDYTRNHLAHQDDRIATAMFYMSNVAQGGATVFPKLGLTVFPVKGSALFWKNLLPSGEGDLNTKHAACPVLEGSKWVANKWIHSHGQELISPCLADDRQLQLGLRRPAPVLRTENFE